MINYASLFSLFLSVVCISIIVLTNALLCPVVLMAGALVFLAIGFSAALISALLSDGYLDL
jgi:hypothetical protein